MKIALVHDYLNEFGGAERVLKTLSEMYPKAPIYTAFRIKGSTADKYFSNRKIIESFLAPILKWKKLYSPLRFLAPLIWGSFDFSEYDLVISSASWYITKGIKTKGKTKHVCYLHTPPRFLYGYQTSIEWQRYLLVRIYAKLVNGYLRKYDYKSAQKPDLIIVNSENVKKRCKKFYGRDSQIIYPPIKVKEIIKQNKETKKEDFYLIVSRVVGAKGIEMAMEMARKTGVKLKIVGEKAGLSFGDKKWKQLESENVEFLGRLSDKQLWQIYGKAKGFLALARDEDLGMTVIEAQAAGTSVIAFWGGGYKETIVEGKTGIFFREYRLNSLIEAIERYEKQKFNKKDLQEQARKFEEEVFVEKIERVVESVKLKEFRT